MTPSNPNNVPTNMGPNMESGPGPADPGLSSAKASYTGSGYGPVGQGTIGVGNPVSVPPSPPPAQVRFFMGQDGNLYVLDNNDKAYVIQASALVPVPAVYSPTK